MRVTATTTRKAITTQLRDFFAAAAITFEDGFVGGGQVFIVDGVAYSPGGAANRFLPGGFDGAYGQAGRLPELRVGQRISYTVRGEQVEAEVIDVLGCANYAAGFVALWRNTDGTTFVSPA